MSATDKPNTDVEMKDDAKKEETKKVEEPTDPFYGNSLKC